MDDTRRTGHTSYAVEASGKLRSVRFATRDEAEGYFAELFRDKWQEGAVLEMTDPVTHRWTHEDGLERLADE